MKIGRIEETETGIRIVEAGLFFPRSFEIDAPDLVEFQKWLLYNLQDVKDNYARVTGMSLRKNTGGMSKFQR